MTSTIESTVANSFRAEALEHRREQITAICQFDRERAAKQARYLENAARLLDQAMLEAGLA